MSPTALRELRQIWWWNAERHSNLHADEYVQTIRRATDSLAQDFSAGGSLGAGSGLRYMLVRRKQKGHGHVVVYRFDDKVVDVLHIFHTAQDWRFGVSPRH